MKIIFAAGGSGGHAYPLIAIARALQEKQPDCQTIFVSSSGSVEEQILPKEGFKLHLIPSGKFNSQSIFARLLTLLKMPLSFFVSAKILFKERPDLILSAGGYAGAPFVITAGLLGFTSAIFEQNRRPGLANSIMAKFCRHIFLNFPASKEFFSEKKKLYLVGHPCRKEIENSRWQKAEVDERFSRKPFRIFVFGGSQGAVGINRLVAAALPYFKELDIEVHHQTGKLDLENVQKAYEKAAFQKAKIEPYVYQMAEAYQAAHLVICRAGASSLAELAAAGKAALLIPLVSKDRHQEFNAQEMMRVGAAECALQPELNGEKLAAIVKGFYTDRKKLAQIASAMQALHQPDASGRIAEICISIIKERSIS